MFLFTLNIYKNKFIERPDINYQYFKSSQAMCAYFINYLATLKTFTLVLSFNGNSNNIFGRDDYLDEQTIYGFDLPMIVKQSHLSSIIPLNFKTNHEYLTTSKLLNCPFALFVDAKILLKQTTDSLPELKASIEWFRLEDFCKVFNAINKDELDHCESWQLLLNDYKEESNNLKLTKYFDYAIKDIICLEDVINKSCCLSDQIKLAQELNVPIPIMLRYSWTQLITDYICQFAITKNILFWTRYIKNSDVKFLGGLNYHTCGVYQNVAPHDLSGAYPSTIIQYNLSPETFIWFEPTQINWNYNEKRYNIINNELHVDLIDSWLNVEGQIIIDNSTSSILQQVVQNFKSNKDLMKFYKNNNDSRYNKAQEKTYKTIINSIYGCFG